MTVAIKLTGGWHLDFVMNELLKAFQINERAIRRVIGRYFSRAEDIEDLTQETFLKCFVADTQENIRNPKAFLFRVARNTAISEIRRKSISSVDYLEESIGIDSFVKEEDASTELLVEERRKLAVLTKAVASLPKETQQAFLMRKMEGLKYRQIAVRLNLPLATVHRLISRALSKCSETMREHGYNMAEYGEREPSTKVRGIRALDSNGDAEQATDD